MEKNKSIESYIGVSQILIGICAFFFILSVGKPIIVPLIYATILAILLNPFVNFLERNGINRILSIAIAVILTLLILFVLIYLMLSQAISFYDKLPQLKIKFHDLVFQILNWVGFTFNVGSEQMNEWYLQTKRDLINKGGTVLGQTLITMSSTFVLVILLPVYIFMLLFYKSLLLEFIAQLFAKEKHQAVSEVLQQSKKLIQSYLIGLLIEAAIIATLNSIGLFMLGIQYALLLGIVGAMLNIIPYIGGVIAIALPVLIALLTKSPVYALAVIVIYFIIQIIDNNFLVPRIVASKVKLNALVSIIVVFISAALWGVAGMFLALPLTAITKVIFDRVEPLKPWGFLLGDNLPPIGKIFFTFPSGKKKEQ